MHHTDLHLIEYMVDAAHRAVEIECVLDGKSQEFDYKLRTHGRFF